MPSAKALTGPQPPNWQHVLAVNTYWGFVHAQSYIQFVDECLDLKIASRVDISSLQLNFGESGLQVPKINFLANVLVDTKSDNYKVVDASASDNLPFHFMANLDSIRRLTDDDKGRRRAGDLHELYLQWDRRVSKIIHDEIYGKDGRAALRRFHGLLSL
jgi:hypothetical protein